MERIIETEHVNRVFAVSSGEFCALKDINVSIPEGAFAILLSLIHISEPTRRS